MSKDDKTLNTALRKVAHDIRNPLAVINGYLMYRKQSEMSAEEKEYLNASLTCVDRLQSLTDEINYLADNNADDQKVQASQKPLQQTSTTQKILPKSVLVVDDDHEIQTQWKILLNQKGINYVGIDRGESLLELDINYDKITTAIVDYEFENSSLTGFDIIEFLMRKKVDKIHLCTGLFQNESICQQAKSYGVNSIIGKPLPEDVLNIL